MVRVALVSTLVLLSSFSFAAHNAPLKKRRVEYYGSSSSTHPQPLQISTVSSTDSADASIDSGRYRISSSSRPPSLLSPFLQRVEKRSFSFYSEEVEPIIDDGDVDDAVGLLMNFSRKALLTDEFVPTSSSNAGPVMSSSSSSSHEFADPTKTRSESNSSANATSTNATPDSCYSTNADVISIQNGRNDSPVDLTNDNADERDEVGEVGEVGEAGEGEEITSAWVARIRRNINLKVAAERTKENLDYLLNGGQRARLVNTLAKYQTTCEEFGEHYLKQAMQQKDFKLVQYIFERIIGHLTPQSPEIYSRIFDLFLNVPNAIGFVDKIDPDYVYPAMENKMKTNRPHDFIDTFVSKHCPIDGYLTYRMLNQVEQANTPILAIKLRSLFKNSICLRRLPKIVTNWTGLSPEGIIDALQRILGEDFER